MPIRRHHDGVDAGIVDVLPSNMTFPARAPAPLVHPVRIDQVDLPQPEGPMIAVAAPR
jgi:hypothetical protein